MSSPGHRSQGLQAQAAQVPGLVLLPLKPAAAALHHVLQVEAETGRKKKKKNRGQIQSMRYAGCSKSEVQVHLNPVGRRQGLQARL